MKPALFHVGLSAAMGMLLLMTSGVAVAQKAPHAARIVARGNRHGAPPCTTCHGARGGGMAAAGFPRLAGLNAAYLEHQLDSFADGSRENAVMQPIAGALGADERRALAEYYSKLPIPAAAAKGDSAPPRDTLGKALATRGRWSRQVPGCVACHGLHGVGVGAHFPPLAGQSATYIANQLKAWQKGTRRNDPLGLMKHVSSALDAKDIQAVSAWFAAQPAVPEAAVEGETP